MKLNRMQLIALALALCATGLTPQEARSEPSSQVEAKELALNESGQWLFARHCAGCHGADGAGDGPARGILSSQPRDLRTGFLAKFPRDQLVARLLTGRKLKIEFDPEAFAARALLTEAVVDYMQRLPKIDWTSVDKGSEIYRQRCESCHGPFGRPIGNLPAGVQPVRDLGDADYQRSTSDTELLGAVRHGRKGMPALVPALPNDAAYPLLSFVRLLSPGHQVYQQTCSNCHGERGRGVGSLGEEAQLPTIVFDAAYFARVDRDDLRVNAWHMLQEHRPRMPHFETELSPGQAEQIIDYLMHSQATGSGALDDAAAPAKR